MSSISREKAMESERRMKKNIFSCVMFWFIFFSWFLPFILILLCNMTNMNIMKYYCAIRNDEQEDFREAWKDFYELMLSERSRTRRTSYIAATTVCEEFFWQT